jgi:hypothetical protein
MHIYNKYNFLRNAEKNEAGLQRKFVFLFASAGRELDKLTDKLYRKQHQLKYCKED